MMTQFSRGSFLATGGALIVSFGLAPRSAGAQAVNAEAAVYPDPAQLDTWIAVAQDGSVTYFTGRIDSGQRKSTAFAQIVAEELDVSYRVVKGVLGDTARTPNQGASTASDGVSVGAKPLRRAAAEARRVLIERAAARFGVDPAQLAVADGVVHVTADPSRKVAYGELVGNRRFDVTLKVSKPNTVGVNLDGAAKLKDPRTYAIVGKTIPAQDIPGKVHGTWPRVHNVRLPGMLHARLVLPPRPGAHVTSVAPLAPTIPGVVQVVHRGDLVAVVARSEWAAIKGANALNVSWSGGTPLPTSAEMFGYLRNAPTTGPQRLVTNIGNAGAALADPSMKTFAASYNWPIQSHGMIGPSCGVADVRSDGVTLYAGTQDPPATREAVAKLLGIPLEKVRVVASEPSGCYGRLSLDDATVAAAVLSQALGKPVRVQFTRQQEHTSAPMPPPATWDLRAAVNASGKIVAWEQREWSWGMTEVELPVMLIPREQPKVTTPPFFRPPSGGGRGLGNVPATQTSRPPGYVYDNQHVVGETVAPLMRGIWMRSPGRIDNNFCGEQFLDEIAAATRQDPLELRTRHVADARSKRVLERIARLAKWDARPSPGPSAASHDRIARGRGIAMMPDQQGTWVATVAHVEVDRLTGNVALTRVYVVADAGLVVNPDGLRAQIEGATLFGASRALKEEVTLDGSKVTSRDWLTYPILRFTEVPEIVVDVVNDLDVAPAGIGEPPNSTMPAAIGNAIFDATGVRLRETPFTPARVKNALA